MQQHSGGMGLVASHGADWFIELRHSRMLWKEAGKNQMVSKLSMLNNLPFANWTNGSNENSS